MKVRELVEELQRWPQDDDVLIEWGQLLHKVEGVEDWVHRDIGMRLHGAILLPGEQR